MVALPSLPRMWFPLRLPGRVEAERGHLGPFDVGPLPRLERDPSEGLGWLLEEPSAWGAFSPAGLEQWTASLARQRERIEGVRAPDAFREFWSSPEYFARIPDWFGWTFGVGDHVVPVSDGGVLIRLLRDQQDCMHWYLYVGQDGSEAVVGMYALFGYEPWEHETPEQLADSLDDYGVSTLDTFIVGEGEAVVYAESFFEFIYRYWLEANIEERLASGEPLTPEQERYVANIPRS